jgi:hypothetical protein
MNTTTTALASIQRGHLAHVIASVLLMYGSLVLVPNAKAVQLTAFSDFGPGNTYGNFGQTIGGQFVNGYEFKAGASGPLSEIDIGIGGSGTFNLTLYTDNGGTLGSSIWSTSNVPVGLGSPNPAVITINSGPSLGLNQNYWLVASGPSASAYWSPNTIGLLGTQYHHDSGSDFYAGNSQVGAFAVKVVPEPATFGMMVIGVLGLAGLVWCRNRGH